MIKLACLAMFAALATMANAASVDEHGRTPEVAYHGDVMGGMKLCELKYELSLASQQSGQTLSADQDPVRCISELQSSGSRALASALKATRKTAAREQLKAFHAAWVPAVRSIPALQGETRARYAVRRNAHWERLDELWARFEIENN